MPLGTIKLHINNKLVQTKYCPAKHKKHNYCACKGKITQHHALFHAHAKQLAPTTRGEIMQQSMLRQSVRKQTAPAMALLRESHAEGHVKTTARARNGT